MASRSLAMASWLFSQQRVNIARNRIRHKIDEYNIGFSIILDEGRLTTIQCNIYLYVHRLN